MEVCQIHSVMKHTKLEIIQLMRVQEKLSREIKPQLKYNGQMGGKTSHTVCNGGGNVRKMKIQAEETVCTKHVQ